MRLYYKQNRIIRHIFLPSKAPPTKLAPDFQQKSTKVKHLLPSSNFVPGANDRVGATVATGAVGTGRPRDTGGFGAGGGCDMVLPRAFGEGIKKMSHKVGLYTYSHTWNIRSL